MTAPGGLPDTAWLVVGLAGDGRERRRLYLSQRGAYDRARLWGADGFHAGVVRLRLSRWTGPHP